MTGISKSTLIRAKRKRVGRIIPAFSFGHKIQSPGRAILIKGWQTPVTFRHDFETQVVGF